MKSVDCDFDPSGTSRFLWPLAGVFAAIAYFQILERVWQTYHLHKLSEFSFWPLLLCVFPFMFSILFSRYIRSALRENLVSARVANNSQNWIAMTVFLIYFSICQFSRSY
jgi:hypothetical protein